MLGCKWTTEPDLLSPGLGELNLNKKVRGSKKPNLNPVCSREDARMLLKDVKLTRRTILAKVAIIPRNVLSAILLCTELTFLVKRAIGDLVDEIVHCTDSTIALNWCKNETI